MTDPHAATLDAVFTRARAAWRPAPALTLSQWAEKYYVLPAESAAEPGRWRTYPYQREIMDAISDPKVREVSIKKSARVGATKMLLATVGYYMHQSPASIMFIRPTVDDVKNFSKDELFPMLRDCEPLRPLISMDRGPKIEAENTLLHKRFPGGKLIMVGANSGSGLRAHTVKVVLFDEVDGYPASAGSDGDPITLGKKRAATFWDRKYVSDSTPMIHGSSRIESLFLEGDQRHFHVPCPTCGYLDRLTFIDNRREGHYMKWVENDPSSAHFVCRGKACIILPSSKHDMIARGQWIAARPFRGHASFSIWSAYSPNPDATWPSIVEDWVKSQGKPEQLKAFTNLVLGESYVEPGDAPDKNKLQERRETYVQGTCPLPVKFITCGVDVQKDRFVFEIVGWDFHKRSWSIDYGQLLGDTAKQEVWDQLLDELLARKFPRPDGGSMAISQLAVDSGYQTSQAYLWSGRHPERVIAVKGMSKGVTPLGQPCKVDLRANGQRYARGARYWPVAVGILKSEFYSWLRMAAGKQGEPEPSGWCHFPEYEPEYFNQLTAEHLVTVAKKTGYSIREWRLIPGRQNHVLDARIYARAASIRLGSNRVRTPVSDPVSTAVPSVAPPTQPPAQIPPVMAPVARVSVASERQGSNFFGPRGKSFFKK